MQYCFLLYLLFQILTIDLGTELAPAISLAYEEIEADIMSQPPRKRSARLVSNGLLAYSYIFAGTMESICSCAAYLYVYVYVSVFFVKISHHIFEKSINVGDEY